MRVDLWADDFDYDAFVLSCVTKRPMKSNEALARYDAACTRNGACAMFGQWNEAIKRLIRAGKLALDREQQTIRRI